MSLLNLTYFFPFLSPLHTKVEASGPVSHSAAASINVCAIYKVFIPL